MNVVKRIIVLASSSAMLIGLGGCSVIDSLNLGQLLRPGGDGADAAAAAPASASAMTSNGAPAPLDLSAATPASAFTMPAPVHDIVQKEEHHIRNYHVSPAMADLFQTAEAISSGDCLSPCLLRAQCSAFPVLQSLVFSSGKVSPCCRAF